MALARPQFCQFIQTSDNGFFVAGYYSNRSGYTTLRVFRTDSNGTPIWDEKLAGVESMGGPMISPIQWEDGGYSVILSGGRVNNFDAAGRSLGAANIQDPICRTNGTVCYDLTPVSLTQNPDGSLNLDPDEWKFFHIRDHPDIRNAYPERDAPYKRDPPPENFDRGDRLHPYK